VRRVLFNAHKKLTTQELMAHDSAWAFDGPEEGSNFSMQRSFCIHNEFSCRLKEQKEESIGRRRQRR
jgi:hypothetical protein